MKRIFGLLLAVSLVFLVVSYFIPISRQDEIIVAGPYETVISTATHPKQWIKWDSSVRQAWLADSASCRFGEDSVLHTVTIEIPGKKIRIKQVNYLLYQVEETTGGQLNAFALSINPYTTNIPNKSQFNSLVVYAHNIPLLHKIFPFLEKGSVAKNTVSELKSYLEDTRVLYGFSIGLKQPVDTIFLTQKSNLLKQDLFKRLPVLFGEIENYALTNQISPSGNKYVSYNFLNNDSLLIMTGITINKKIAGDYIFNCRQIPGTQGLAVGRFEGPFKDRLALYSAMEKFLADRHFIRGGVSYEKYLGPLPTSDSSIVKIELNYPLL